VPSAATTESHPHSSSKSLQDALLGRYLIRQLAASSFSTASFVCASHRQVQSFSSECIGDLALLEAAHGKSGTEARLWGSDHMSLAESMRFTNSQ